MGFHPLQDPNLCDRPEFGQARIWNSMEKELARKWFTKNVKVYVLSLLSDVDRWQMISTRLNDLDIPAMRFPGMDMRKPDAMDIAKREGWIPQRFNFTLDQEIAYKGKF